MIYVIYPRYPFIEDSNLPQRSSRMIKICNIYQLDVHDIPMIFP